MNSRTIINAAQRSVMLVSMMLSQSVSAVCGFDAALMSYVDEAIFKDESCFVGWADRVTSYNPGAGVDRD